MEAGASASEEISSEGGAVGRTSEERYIYSPLRKSVTEVTNDMTSYFHESRGRHLTDRGNNQNEEKPRAMARPTTTKVAGISSSS